MRDAAGRRPARQEHRRRRDQLEGAAREDPASSSPAGARGGREIYQPPVPAARAGLLVRRRPSSRTSRRATGSPARRSSGPCSRCSRSARPTRRSRRRTTRPTASRRASGPTRARGSSGWPSGCAPGSSGRTRSTASTRRRPFGGYKESGFGREGGRHGLEPYLTSTLSLMARLPVRKTLQALHRRRVPALRVGPHLRGAKDRTSRAPRARTSATPSSAARAAQPRWAGATAVQPRADALPDRGDARGAGRRVRRPLCDRQGDEVERGDRPLGLVRGLGRQAARRCSAPSNPVAGPYFNFTIPEPTGVVGDRRPRRAAAARARLPDRAGARRRQRRRRGRLGGAAAARRSSSPRRSRRATFPAGAVNLLTGRRAELAPWLASHMDVNAIDLTGADGPARPSSSGPRPTTSSGSFTARADCAEPVRDLGVPRAEDRLAPDRGLGQLRVQVEILGSGGAVTIPRPGCGCRVCVEARGEGLPYARSGPSVFVHGPDVADRHARGVEAAAQPLAA